jgi:hypothetical protein
MTICTGGAAEVVVFATNLHPQSIAFVVVAAKP